MLHVIMVSVFSSVHRYAECRYDECRYAKWRYAECRGVLLNMNKIQK